MTRRRLLSRSVSIAVLRSFLQVLRCCPVSSRALVRTPFLCQQQKISSRLPTLYEGGRAPELPAGVSQIGGIMRRHRAINVALLFFVVGGSGVAHAQKEQVNKDEAGPQTENTA